MGFFAFEMPRQRRKYNVRFSPVRIKKIMQKDAEVGRIAAAVPVIISRALEMFIKSFLIMTSEITLSKHTRVMSVAHMKQCIENEKLFDFLKDLAEQPTAPASQGEGDVKETWLARRKRWQEISIRRKQHGEAERSSRPKTDSFDNTEHSDDSDSELIINLGAKLQHHH